jgi:hypothetical protein
MMNSSCAQERSNRLLRSAGIGLLLAKLGQSQHQRLTQFILVLLCHLVATLMESSQ